MKRIKLNTKFIIIVFLISIIPISIASFVSINSAVNALEDAKIDKLVAVRDVKKMQIEDFFVERFSDIKILSKTLNVRNGIVEVGDSYDKDGLFGTDYNATVSKYEDFFKNYIEAYNYDDLFLLNLKGDIIYTVEKESDLGENVLNSSLLKDSGLKKGFLDGHVDISIIDFKFYEPSNAPASFITAPILNNDELTGVIILQISDYSIDAIMKERSGLGETGETYLVANDLLMRSDSRFSDIKTIGIKEVDTKSVTAALDGNVGVDYILDYRNKEVLSAYSPLSIAGLNWVVIAEIDKSEIFSSVNRLILSISIVLVALLTMIIIVLIIVNNKFVLPIKKISTTAKYIAESNDLSSSVNYNGDDEIADLIFSFNTMVDKLRYNTENLESLIENRTKELILSKEIAEKASKVKSEFLANMSHEIRTPMNAVMGLNGLMKHTDLSIKQKDYVDKIGRSANNLLTIINDILDFSKLESGKLLIEQIEFSLDDVLRDLLTVISFKAYEKNLELLIKKNPRIPNKMIGDPLRLGQALLNITTNAIKFTETGEVLIKVDLINKVKSIDLRFTVEDTGIGMNEEQLGNLFSAFSQADISTSRKYGGTGLGLVISENIINLMGGEISVSSEYGKGSKFSFDLSFGKADSDERATSIKVLPENIKDIKILAIDDGESARIILNCYLSEFINKPVIVSSGQEALEVIKEQSFDLVLIDWRMPGMDGVESWKLMQESGNIDDDTKAILVTAFSYDEMTDKVIESNFNSILSKPFTQSNLFDSILNAYMEGAELVSYDALLSKLPEGFDEIIGAKLLLVEENEINQQVAREMLELEGFFVAIAGNGQIAVDMVKEKKYDLIIMDLQMPVMDGYTASETIRREVCEITPIVALSADAMSGVKDRVMKSGINDYVSKPIDKIELLNALMKWIEHSKREKNNIKRNNDISIDQDYLARVLVDFNTKNGLMRSSGSNKLYLDLLSKFESKYKDFFIGISNSIKLNNINKAKADIHLMKGVTGNIGAEALNKIVAEIEEKLKLNDLDDIAKLIDSASQMQFSMNEQISVVLIENYDVLNARTGNVDIDDARLTIKLKQLLRNLEDYSTSADELCDEIAQYKNDVLTKDSLNKIKQGILDFEFEIAINESRRLIDKLSK